MVRRTGKTTLAACAAAALLLAACGGDGGDDTAAPEDGTLRVVGTDDLRFEPETLSASAGTIQVELDCQPAVNHDFVIEETGEEVITCAPGETTTGSVDLEAGEYTYICTVPGHETTMRGTLTVT